jgi:glycosyltransferase involved in cell wall biosynthesis
VNIAILQHTYNPTTIGWVQGLEERGHRVVVIVASEREPLGGADDGELVVVADLPWTQHWGRRLFKGRAKAVVALPRPRELWRAMRAHRPDLVLIKVYSLRNVLAAIFALAMGARRLGWLEQVPPASPEWRVLRCLGVLPRRWFTAVADRPGGIASEGGVPTSAGLPLITYAAPRWPRDAPAGRHADPVRPLRVLTASTFTNPAAKRPWWTLVAARRAGLLDGRMSFTFAGLGGPEQADHQRLTELIATCAAGSLVEVRSDVPYRAMVDLYDDHDVLVLPSAAEQFGMVVPEAMSRGLAVVVTDVVGAIGCIVDEITGLIVDADDIDDLGRALVLLEADRSLVDRLGVAAQRFIDEHASPASTAERIERFAFSRSRARAGTRTRR